MQLIFDSVDEVKNFVKEHLKGTRRGKGDSEIDDAVQAPAPIQPPTAFAPTPSTGFPAAPAPNVSFPAASPEATALVTRISVKIDSAIAGGQPPDAVLSWFRQRCGAEAANATLNQIKEHFLARLSIPQLEKTAKLMGA